MGCSAGQELRGAIAPGESLGVAAAVGRIAADGSQAGLSQVLAEGADLWVGDDVERSRHRVGCDRYTEAKASTMTRPKVSVRLGKTKQSASA